MRLIFFVFINLVCLYAYSQKGEIKGVVLNDALEPLEFCTIMLLNPEDSVMLHFANSNSKGNFNFKDIECRDYLMQCNYLGYESYWYPLSIASKCSLDVGSFEMKPSAEMISTIEITGELIPMKIGNDTVIYNTASFPTLPGETVEDLLKKLPGIDVARDGSIKAFGENVQNVLVDGKEFFGKDTRIATKNLDADAVENVGVFDKKSESSEFTGIADGRDERSINLELKADRKVGYFGNVEAGGGPDGKYKTKANINRFRPDQRMSFIGMGNNINEQGFSMNDYMDFMGGIGAFMGGGQQEINAPFGMDSQDGIQRSWAGGINYDQDFSSTSSLNGSIFYNDSNNDLNSFSDRQNVVANQFFNTDETETQQTSTANFSANFKFKTEIDSLSDIIARGSLSAGNTDLHSLLQNSANNEEGLLINALDRNYQLTGEGVDLSASLTYRKKFLKPGRTFVLTGEHKSNNNTGNGYLNATNSLFQPTLFEQMIEQDQLKKRHSKNYAINTVVTERLTRKFALEWNGYYGYENGNSSSEFFDRINGVPVLNLEQSTSYTRDNLLFDTGLRLAYNKKKLNTSIGINYQDSKLTGSIANPESRINYRSKAVLPSFFLNRNLNLGSSFSLNYSTNLNQPNIQQLQPIEDNRDPFNIYKGNPNLIPEYKHSLRVAYMSYDAFYFRMIHGRLAASYTRDKITDIIEIDSSLRRRITPVNVKNEKFVQGKFEFSNPIKPLKIMAKISLRANYGRSILSINEAINDLDKVNTDLKFSIENRNRKVVDAMVGVNWKRGTANYSNASELNQQYDEFVTFSELKWKISSNWDLRTQFDFSRFSQSYNPSITKVSLLQAGLSRYFLPGKKLKVSLTVFDVFNQNNGISRSAELNYAEYKRSNVLGRYFLISASYNLKGYDKKNDAIEVKFDDL